MTVKGHMRRLPMKRYHKSLVFHHPYPLALQCKLEFLPLPVIASIGHIGGLRHTPTHTQGQICDVVRLRGKVTWMSSQVGANIGLLSAPFFRLLFCLGICPTQPSLTAVSAILPLQRAKEEWDAQTRWSVVLWKLSKQNHLYGLKVLLCSKMQAVGMLSNTPADLLLPLLLSVFHGRRPLVVYSH